MSKALIVSYLTVGLLVGLAGCAPSDPYTNIYVEHLGENYIVGIRPCAGSAILSVTVTEYSSEQVEEPEVWRAQLPSKPLNRLILFEPTDTYRVVVHSAVNLQSEYRVVVTPSDHAIAGETFFVPNALEQGQIAFGGGEIAQSFEKYTRIPDRRFQC